MLRLLFLICLISLSSEVSANDKDKIINKLQLVSREEFEVQKEVLRKTREKLENLEKKIQKKMK